MADQTTPDAHDEVQTQAQEQTGQRQVQLRIDEADLTTSYANAFRTNTSAEELVLDLGMNLMTRSPQAQGDGTPGGQIQFKVNHRVVMNYYTTKRLAILLGQIVRQHEENFGELKLNAAERGTK